MWDEERARRYREWYATPTGAFALHAEQHLLRELFSQWPRRGHTLLDVGCGPGVFLEFLWGCGFDVSGLDASPDMIELARQQLGHRADFHIGQADYLPFEDNAFDYVSLITVLEFVPDLRAALKEAFRVASRGIVIGFLNRYSLYYLARGLNLPGTEGTLRHARWLTTGKLASVARSLCPTCTCTFRSILHGPAWTWRNGPMGALNTYALPLGTGAFVGLRIDLGPTLPLTGMPLRIRKVAQPNVCPPIAMGCQRPEA